MDTISRRGFLKLSGAAAVTSIAALTIKEASSPNVKPPFLQAETAETIVKTTCALCPSGCGLDVRVVDGKAVKVEGNPLHPLNQGTCCLKGQTSLEILYSPERIQRPRARNGERGADNWKEVSWDEALQMVVSRLKELRQSGQSHSVAFLHGNMRGQMRSLIQHFMTLYGSPNVISTSSLGEQAARFAMFLSQGINGLPVYDLNNANYVMTFGGNLLESSRQVMGVIGAAAFMRRGRPNRGKLVAAHPRLSLTGIKSDEWVPIRPGTYAALALGMANVIINSNLYDQSFIQNFTFGFEDFEDETGSWHQGFKSMVLEHYTLERAATITGVPSEKIARLAGEFATNRPAIAVMPTEPGELAAGNSLYTAMAIHALNALVGSIDCAGGVLVQRFPTPADWPSYSLDSMAQAGLAKARVDGAGTGEMPLALSAYQNLAEQLLSETPYPVNALFLLNANPVYDLPNGELFAQALKKVPFVVSFASTLDESAAYSDLILPASTFLEEFGDDYIDGTGYAGVSLRQPVVAPVHDTRSPGDILLEIASRFDSPLSDALPWQCYQDLVMHRLSAVPFDWDVVETNGCWSEMVYFNAKPGSPAWSQVVGRDRFHAPKDGRFDLFSRELFALLQAGETGSSEAIDLACLPHFDAPTSMLQTDHEADQYPFLLITQSLITQSQNWQGIIPTLQETYGLQANAKWTSWIEINPTAAKELGLEEGELVWVESPGGRVQASVRLYAGIWPNAVFMPGGMGHFTRVKWGRNAADHGFVGSNPNLLKRSSNEALSGQAIYDPTRVRITKGE